MKNLIIAIPLLFTVACFAQTKEPYSWYKCFTGKIDKYPVTMHLYKAGNEYTGYYYYHSTEDPIALAGHKEKLLKIIAGDKETFEGSLTDTVFSGTWSSNNKILPFRITQRQDSTTSSFDYVIVAGSKKLGGNSPGTDELSYFAATVWPSALLNTPSTDSIKKIIAGVFSDGRSYREDIGKTLLQQKNKFIK